MTCSILRNIAPSWWSSDVVLRDLKKGLVSVFGHIAGRKTQQNVDWFKKAVELAGKGLNPKELRRVLGALHADSFEPFTMTYNRVINKTYKDFVTTEKKTTITMGKLSEKEVNSYFAFRSIMNKSYLLDNAALVRQAELHGLTFFDFRTVTGTVDSPVLVDGQYLLFESHHPNGFLVKKQTPGYFGEIPKSQHPRSIFNTITGKPIEFTDALIKKFNKGEVDIYKIAKNESGEGEQLLTVRRFSKMPERSSTGHFVFPEGTPSESYRYILVNKGNVGLNGIKNVVRNLPSRLLKYRPNYFPVLRGDVNFVVQEEKLTLIDGKPNQTTSIVRAFAGTKENAIALAKSLGLDPEKAVKPSTEQIVRDNELVTTGALASSRSNGEFLVDGIARPLDPWEALNQTLSRTGYTAAYNEFKEQAVRGFLSAYGEKLLKQDGTVTFSSPVNPNIPLIEKKEIEAIRNSLRTIMLLPTPSSKAFNGVYDQLAKVFDSAGLSTTFGKKVASKLYGKSKGISSSILSFNYYASFAFNLVMLPVQAALVIGMFGLNPALTTKALARYIPIRYGVTKSVSLGALAGSTASDKLAMDLLKRSGAKMSAQHIDDVVKLMIDSGWNASVLASSDNPLSNLSLKLGGKGPMSVVKNVSHVFFKEGELISRIVSMDIAYSLALKRFGKTSLKELTEAEKTWVLQESMKRSMVMDATNKAAWQQNPAGAVFLQFFQITTKMIENMTGLNKQFTAQERVKLFMTYLAALGTQGLPGSPDAWISLQLDKIGINDKNNPHMMATVRQGLAGLLQSWMFGTDIYDVSGRLSPLKGAETLMQYFKLVTSFGLEGIEGPFEFPSARPGIGAWVTQLTNLAKIGGAFYDITRLAMSNEGLDFSNSDDVRSSLMYIAATAADVFTASRNVKQAWIWENMGWVTDTKGNLLIDAVHPDFLASVIGKAIGVQPSVVTSMNRVYRLKAEETGMSVGTSEETVRKMVSRIYRDARSGIVSPEFAEKTSRILLEAQGYPLTDIMEIQLDEIQKLMEVDSKLLKELEEATFKRLSLEYRLNLETGVPGQQSKQARLTELFLQRWSDRAEQSPQ